MMRCLPAVAVVLASGCCVSHAPGTDASDGGEAGDVVAGEPQSDAGSACRFSFVDLRSGSTVLCTVDLGSTQGCTDAARCLCEAWSPGATETELIQCVWWETTPRGNLTFADFCAVEPPTSATLGEALAGYLRGASPTGTIVVSPECAAIPALLGTLPYQECSLLAERLCPCLSADCDLDALLGRSCLSLTRGQARCILGRIPSNAGCAALGDLARIVLDCA